MSGSGSMGGKWEPVIFYKSYNAKRVPSSVRKMTLKEFEDELSEEEKRREIKKICVRSSELEDLPWFNNKGTRHYFVQLSVEGGRQWTIEKTQTGILIQHSHCSTLSSNERNPSDEEDALGNKRVNVKLVDDSEGFFRAAKGKTIGTVINWLRDTRQHLRSYNVLETNCIHFARDLFKLICEREMKELKQVVESFTANALGIAATAAATLGMVGAIFFRRNN